MKKLMTYCSLFLLSLLVTSYSAEAAFPDGWARKCPIVIQNAYVDTTLSDYPLLLNEDTLPAEMLLSTGSYPALSTGGDIRFSSDSSGNVQLSLEIVSFTLDGSAELWVKVPSISSSVNTTIYVWYSKTGETQPAEDASYGKESVWNDDYMMVHHMSGSTYTDLDDSTSYDNDVIDDVGTITYNNTGKIGDSILVAGSTDFLEIDESSSLNPTVLTLQAWIYSTSTASNDGFVSKMDEDSNNTRGYSLKYYYDAPALSIGDGDDDPDLAHQTDITLNAWRSLSGTFQENNSTNTRIWYEGVKSNSGMSVEMSGSANEGMVLGRRYTDDSSGDDFEGAIDEVRLTDVILSDGWITSEYKNLNAPSTFSVEGTPENAGSGARRRMFMVQ